MIDTEEIAQYIHEGFDILKGNTFNEVLIAVEKLFHRTVYIKEDKRLVCVAFYMRLTDETLEKLRLKEINLKNEETFRSLEKEEGKNIHIFALRADNMKVILKGLKSGMKKLKPKTVSWFKPYSEDIFIIRNKLLKHY